MAQKWAHVHGLKPSNRTPYWQAIVGSRWTPDLDIPAWADHGQLWLELVALRNKRPVAFTSHPYDEPDRQALDLLASEHDLTVEVHPPGKSWYHPSAWLVVLVRAPDATP